MTVGELKAFLADYKDNDLIITTFDGCITDEQITEYPRVINHADDFPNHMYEEPGWRCTDPLDIYKDVWNEGLCVVRVKE